MPICKYLPPWVIRWPCHQLPACGRRRSAGTGKSSRVDAGAGPTNQPLRRRILCNKPKSRGPDFGFPLKGGLFCHHTMEKPCIAQRRRVVLLKLSIDAQSSEVEKAKPGFRRTSVRKTFLTSGLQMPFGLDRRSRKPSAFLCVSAPQRENMLLRHSQMALPDPETRFIKTE
ncbi:MAG: hypothetical protein [Olavius algarvensis Delta 4 endosymbiont]|nr:MAG: hypothetical protein [Olavius algarvensis Delta 4 endosymbiont]